MTQRQERARDGDPDADENGAENVADAETPIDAEPNAEGVDPGSDVEGERHIPIEVSVGAGETEHPAVDENTRVDVQVEGQMYPTARLADGRYVAWWFDYDAPDPDAPATTEWVAAPTRFLAAGTLHELWEDPTAFDALADGTAGRS